MTGRKSRRQLMKHGRRRMTCTLRRRRCSSPVVQVTEFGPRRAAVAPGQLPGRITQQLQCQEVGCMQDPQHTKAQPHNHSMTLQTHGQNVSHGCTLGERDSMSSLLEHTFQELMLL